jgi:hypothetical protein
MLEKSLWIAVGFLAIALFVFAGCEKQAKSGDQTMKTGSKCSMAGKAADANSTKTCAKMDKKTCPMKDKKACPKNCKKPCCVKKDAKCVSDANSTKTCAMKDKNKKGCPLFGKKACPKNCKKPCCAKKDAKCKTADANDANAPAKKVK